MYTKLKMMLSVYLYVYELHRNHDDNEVHMTVRCAAIYFKCQCRWMCPHQASVLSITCSSDGELDVCGCRRML